MALELPALCSDFFGGKWEEPGDAIQVTWGIRGFPVKAWVLPDIFTGDEKSFHHVSLVLTLCRT